jgi:putative flippase GtrA
MAKKKTKVSKEAQKTVKQGAKFGVVGVSNTLIDYILFMVITTAFNVPLHQTYLVKFISGPVAMLNSFFWNRRWTFQSKAAIAPAGAKFLAVNLTGVFMIRPFLLWVFTVPAVALGEFGFQVAQAMGIVGLLPDTVTPDWMVKTVAFGMATVIGAVWDFFLYKYWAFKEK